MNLVTRGEMLPLCGKEILLFVQREAGSGLFIRKDSSQVAESTNNDSMFAHV